MAEEMSYARRFVMRTSLKSVPRILHAECLALRMVWLLSFLIFLCVSSFLTWNLVQQFLAQEKVIVLKEDHAQNLEEYRFIRPQFSVCNLNPFSSNPDHRTPTPSQYANYVNNFTTCQNCQPDVTSELNDLRHELLSTPGYFRYIGPEGARAVGHRKETLIVECSAIYIEAEAHREKRCEEVFHFHSEVSEEYFNCYTLQYRDDLDPELLVTGVSMVLYLDNDQRQSVWSSERLTWWPSEGAVMAPTPGNFLPTMTISGVHLTPGAYNQVTVKASERARLDRPKGSCRKEFPESILSSITSTDHKLYTNSRCLKFCLAQQVAQVCGCHDVSLPYANINGNVNTSTNTTLRTYCGTLDESADWYQLLSDINCARAARRNAQPSCNKLCPLACVEKTYAEHISTSRWPQYQRHRELYDVLVTRGLVSDNRSTMSDIEVRHFVERNVLKVSMYMADLKHVEVTEVAKTTLTDFISSLGGALNLWSGITVLVMVEMLDFVIHLVWKSTVSRRNANATDPS